MAQALALGADRDFCSRLSGLACEYLLLNGARIDAKDAGGGDTPLHLAARHGSTGQVRSGGDLQM